MMTGGEWVPACRPTIRPRVVIIPEVVPKHSPVLSDSLIRLVAVWYLKICPGYR